MNWLTVLVFAALASVAGTTSRTAVSDQARAHRHAVPRRQRTGCGAAGDRREALQRVGPAGDRREPARRQRLHRHRGREEGGARRLYAGADGRRAHGAAASPVQEHPVRRHQGLRSGGDVLSHLLLRGRAGELDLEGHEGPHRRGESEERRSHVRLVVRRQPRPRRRGDARVGDRHADDPRAVQGNVAAVHRGRQQRRRVVVRQRGVVGAALSRRQGQVHRGGGAEARGGLRVGSDRG